MGFHSLDSLRSELKCFDFMLYSDGHSVSAQFSRPIFQAGAEIRPMDVDVVDGDKVFAVDPGQKMAFTAMEGLSSPDVPAPMLKYSAKEYYHESGLNRTRKKRDLLKKRDFDALGPDSIQAIESNMPSRRTVRVDRVLDHVGYVSQHYRALVGFYDWRFNDWKLSNYSGKQRALSEVQFIAYIRFPRCLLAVPRRVDKSGSIGTTPDGSLGVLANIPLLVLLR